MGTMASGVRAATVASAQYLRVCVYVCVRRAGWRIRINFWRYAGHFRGV